MSSTKTPICFPIKIDNLIPIHIKSPKFHPYPVMWRSFAKVISSKTLKRQSFFNSQSLSRSCSSLGFSKSKFGTFVGFPEMGFTRDELFSKPRYAFVRSINGLCPRRYASVAEAVSVSSTDVEEDTAVGDEFQELLAEMKKEVKKEAAIMGRRRRRKERGMSKQKYQALMRRQVKIETEAWEQAAKEYKELLKDMCEQKLAPNLPYVKSLFLGWFEPLRDKIVEEQESCREGKNRGAYAPYFDELPADMMAVITMHKLMALLMTGGENGSARVVQAACSIGEAIEQEVSKGRNFFFFFIYLH